MKIALVVPGGVDASAEYRVIPALLALIRRLSARHELHVFALRQQPRPATWELLGARVHNIGTSRTPWRAIQAILSEHRRRAFELVHSIWSGPPGFVAVAAARLLGIPSVVHLAGGELAALPAVGYGGRLTWRGRLGQALVLNGASTVTAASAPMIDAAAAMGIPAARLPLGVDLREWPAREPVRRDPQRTARLVHVASLNRIKDQPTLLRALALLAASGVDFQMDVVGEDTLHGAVQRLALELGLAARVHFHGFLPHRELRAIIEASHVMMLSSLHEAGPLAMLEAAALGVPTVGTAVGHIAEWSPAAALAVPVGNAPALAAHTRGLLADEALRLAIAREAQRRACDENADRTAQSFEAIYARLVNSRNM